MKKTILPLIGIIFLLNACSKQSLGDGSVGRTKYLTSGKWMIISSNAIVAYGPPVGNQSVDLYAAMPVCKKDDLIFYNSNNSITADEGASKCSLTDPQQFPAGTWSLNDSETVLTFTSNGSPISADILQLDSMALSFRYTTVNNGISSTRTDMYSHIK